MADPVPVQPIRELCDGLLSIMRAGSRTPFMQRFQMLAQEVDRAFDLPTVLQLSVGPSWSSLPSDQQNALQTAFRRYTVANYVNNFERSRRQGLHSVQYIRQQPAGCPVINPHGTPGETGRNCRPRRAGKFWPHA
jgi:ABC-type transporter MlaC component